MACSSSDALVNTYITPIFDWTATGTTIPYNNFNDCSCLCVGICVGRACRTGEEGRGRGRCESSGRCYRFGGFDYHYHYDYDS